MSLIVQKYGGSSLASPGLIRNAACRIAALKSEGHEVIAVVSAMGRMTDHLIRLARRTVKTPPQRELDMLMTAGERVSMALLAMVLEEQGVPAISFTGSQSGILTSNDHTDAKIVEIRAHRIREELLRGKVVIVAGFQGVSASKEITTLGRGGSDTTAVALAAALGAARCEILTDVDGLFTMDPRLHREARLISSCSYDEGVEMASLGAKMHARSLELARRFRVSVRIASSHVSTVTGTDLCPENEDKKMERPLVRAIASKSGFHYFSSRAELREIAAVAAEVRAPLSHFHFANGEVAFLCESSRADRVREKLKGRITKEQAELATVSVVGDGLGSSPEVLPLVLSALGLEDAPCFLVSTGALSLTLAIPESARTRVAKRLHVELIEKSGEVGSPLERGLRITEASPIA